MNGSVNILNIDDMATYCEACMPFLAYISANDVLVAPAGIAADKIITPDI